MMPVVPPVDIPPKDPMDFKKKYKTLKRKMRLLVYEQECFMEELRKTQRKLLKLQRDKSFLLDRLVTYDKVEETSGDSEATASSDSEGEGKAAGVHKKKTSQALPGQISSMPSLLEAMNHPNVIKSQPPTTLVAPSGIKSPDQAKRKGKVTKKAVKLPVSGFIKVEPGSGNAPGPSNIVVASPGAAVHPVGAVGHMTREELERHLEMKQSKKPMFMSLEKTPYSLPDDIFSHDNSNSSDLMEKVLKEEDSNLVIDMPR